MKTMGLSAGRGYRKCAKIVGEVMGNFSSSRRCVDLRHPRPVGAGLQHALPDRGRAGQFGSIAAIVRGDALHEARLSRSPTT